MLPKTLGNLMRAFTIAVAACGLFLCAFVIPVFGRGIIASAPEFRGWFLPWLIFAWLAALPCFAILVYVLKVANAVANDTVFTQKTAKWVKAGAILLSTDAAFVFAGSIMLFLLSMSHPGILLSCVIVFIFLLTLALLAAVLSRYLSKAALLQEESEGTL